MTEKEYSLKSHFDLLLKSDIYIEVIKNNLFDPTFL